MIRSSFALVLPLLCALAAAQTATTSIDQTKSAEWSKSVGSSNNGIEFGIAATASYDRDSADHGYYSRRSEISADAEATVHLFGSDIQAAWAGGEVFAERHPFAYTGSGGSYTASYAQSGGGSAGVKVGGRTLWSLPDWSCTSACRKSMDKEFGPYMAFPTAPSFTFWIGPVPLSLSGNVGVEAFCRLDLWSNPGMPGVEVEGTAGGLVLGEVSFSVGLACARASLVVELEFGRVEAGPVVHVSEGDVGGTFEVELTPVSIEVRAEASWCLGSASETLFRYSTDAISTRKTLF